MRAIVYPHPARNPFKKAIESKGRLKKSLMIAFQFCADIARWCREHKTFIKKPTLEKKLPHHSEGFTRQRMSARLYRAN
jgi:hypothetical protein